jgi:hypothetical protein
MMMPRRAKSKPWQPADVLPQALLYKLIFEFAPLFQQTLLDLWLRANTPARSALSWLTAGRVGRIGDCGKRSADSILFLLLVDFGRTWHGPDGGAWNFSGK